MLTVVCTKKNKRDLTYQLNDGHVSLPPQVLSVLWPKGSNEIVRVHYNMYIRVEETNKNTLLTGQQFQVTPREQSSDRVMINV